MKNLAAQEEQYEPADDESIKNIKLFDRKGNPKNNQFGENPTKYVRKVRSTALLNFMQFREKLQGIK